MNKLNTQKSARKLIEDKIMIGKSNNHKKASEMTNSAGNI